MVKAIIFDLFETLITESRTRPAGVSALASELGCEREAFRAQWKARRPAVTLGQITFRQALGDIATLLGSRAEDATLQRLCDERIRTKSAPFERIEDQVLGVIEHVRERNVRLGVISNCFREDVVAWPRCSLARHFDCAVFSFEVSLAKPDPRIYLEAARRLQADVSETWFIGDGMDEELSGATRAGLRAFRALWFLRRWPNFREEPLAVASLSNVDDVVSLIQPAPPLPPFLP